MPIVNIEHNLMDFELQETFEKALKSVRLGIQRPDRKFKEQALEHSAAKATKIFAKQMESMVSDMEKVINGR